MWKHLYLFSAVIFCEKKFFNSIVCFIFSFYRGAKPLSWLMCLHNRLTVWEAYGQSRLHAALYITKVCHNLGEKPMSRNSNPSSFMFFLKFLFAFTEGRHWFAFNGGNFKKLIQKMMYKLEKPTTFSRIRTITRLNEPFMVKRHNSCQTLN